MGVTGAMYKSLRFDGEDSRDYGVYITGEAVFNSPERDVEMISIPGRNGEYARDTGRFMNIEVTYPAGLFGVDPADFADAISDFRNMLGSRVGYCRLEDDYNPGEYRMAVFKAGLDVEPANLEAGEFTITFNCKPQRFLTTGETAVELQSGDTITNPTLFESRPQLQVWGYGNIDMRGQEITINNIPIGWALLANAEPNYRQNAFTFSEDQLNVGDTITVQYGTVIQWGLINLDPENWQGSHSNVNISANPDMLVKGIAGSGFAVKLTLDAITLTAGTPWGTTIDMEGRLTSTYNGTTVATNYKVRFGIAYDGAGTLSTTYTYITAPATPYVYDTENWHKFTSVYGNSTKSAIGAPAYIDLDIGEAYYIDNNLPISINNAVTIPAILPTLKPGSNTITYDNTITQFKVVPRWWKL